MSTSSRSLTTLGFCLTLERGDGAGLAVTNYDRPISVEGRLCRPIAGLLPGAIQQGDRGVPTAEIRSAVRCSLLRKEDLSIGRWDHARATLTAIDTETQQSVAFLSSGHLDQVAVADGEFTVDVASVPSRLRQPVCPVTSPECRASLGDKHCRVNLAPLRQRVTVLYVRGQWMDVDAAVGTDYVLGAARFLDGALSGINSLIVDVADQAIRVRDLGAHANIGDRLILTKGCDKRPETCRTRFANMANFRGEPHVPGTDFLMRYPGA